MAKKTKDHSLVVDYKELGTISIDELAHAILADLHTLKELYNVKYVTGPKLRLPATNEYGDRLRVYDPDRRRQVVRIRTHHFRPACLDYRL